MACKRNTQMHDRLHNMTDKLAAITSMHTFTFPDMHGVVTGCQSSFRHSGLSRCLSPVSDTFLVRSGFPPATST